MTSTTEIMHEMDRTRDDIRATLEAIEGRLSVDNVVQQVIMPTREQAMEYGRIFGDAVRANPLALGVTALGIGWLMLGPRAPTLPALPSDKDARAMRGPGQRSVNGSGSRLDPSRMGEPAKRMRARSADVGRTARDSIREAGSSARDAVREKAASAREAAREAGVSTRNAAEATANRLREAASEGRSRATEARHRATEAFGHTSEVIRDAAADAYEATRRTAARVPGRVRHGAGTAGEYVREHPVATAAVLALGGAALALVMSRRALQTPRDEDVDEALVMPETPYASGEQADFDAPLRNPTRPLTPEDEQEVYAAGDVSTDASRPKRDASGCTGQVGGDGGAGTISAATSTYPAEAGKPAETSRDATAASQPTAASISEPTVLPVAGERKNNERTSSADAQPDTVIRPVAAREAGGG